MSNKLRQFQSLLNEGISQEDLADSLMNRLQMRYPDLLDKYGYDAVEDAVNDVASFHAGAEELGSSDDVSIMLKEIIKSLESEKLDELAMPYSEFKDERLWRRVAGSAGHKLSQDENGNVVAIDQLGHHAGGFDPMKKVWYIKGSSINEDDLAESHFYNPRRRYVDPDSPMPEREPMPRHVPSQDEIEAEKEHRARKRAELDKTMSWMFPDKKGVTEGVRDDAMAGLQRTVDFAKQHGYRILRSPAGKVIKFVNKAIDHTLVARVDNDGDSINVNFEDWNNGMSGNDDASYFDQVFKDAYVEALEDHQYRTSQDDEDDEDFYEGLGTPYPGTYEQENNMFKTKGPRQTPKIAFEEQEKIASRYDPDEFDAMVKRVGQRAKEGPLKTVWDPVKRVYKNVPVKQEPVKESSILKGLRNVK